MKVSNHAHQRGTVSDPRTIQREICHPALSWLLSLNLALVSFITENHFFFSFINLISQGHSHWHLWFIRQSQCCWKQLVTHPFPHAQSHWHLDISEPYRSLWVFISHCPLVPIHPPPPATFMSLPLVAARSLEWVDFPLEFLGKTTLYFL